MIPPEVNPVVELLVVLLAPALFLLPLAGFGIVVGLVWGFLRDWSRRT